MNRGKYLQAGELKASGFHIRTAELASRRLAFDLVEWEFVWGRGNVPLGARLDVIFRRFLICNTSPPNDFT
jgi:hypothetical protein